MKSPLIVCALWLGLVALAGAQQTTERFIPLGQSPGLSGKSTVIGAVGTVDPATWTLLVRSDSLLQRVVVTDTTRIWLDRSAARQSTEVGTLTDLRPGRRVEVKFRDETARTTAEWIKIDTAP